MAYVCCAETDMKEKLQELKLLVEDIESKISCCPVTPCQTTPPKPPQISCCQCCCPAFNNKKEPAKPPCPPEPPDVMICYKMPGAKGSKKSSRNSKRLKKSKSRELRASFLHVGCDCEKRNGLQDDCLRTGCHGSPDCLTKPEPICGPSEFAGGKHLGRNTYNFNGESSGDGNGKEDTITANYKCYPAKVVKSEEC